MIASRSAPLAGAFTSPALQKSSEWPYSKHGEAGILAPLLWTRSYPTSKGPAPISKPCGSRRRTTQFRSTRKWGSLLSETVFWRRTFPITQWKSASKICVSSTCSAILGQDLLKLGARPPEAGASLNLIGQITAVASVRSVITGHSARTFVWLKNLSASLYRERVSRTAPHVWPPQNVQPLKAFQ